MLAVSGGSDSMALLWHMLDMGFEHINVVTINHGLRSEAKDEAVFVQTICEREIIPHSTISVDVKTDGNLQSNARDARYKAITDHCKTHHIKHVFLGHTADDQAETFMLRAFRGSGVDGLTGMVFKRELAGLTFWRPLLGMRRADLRTTLIENSWKWIDDPSNVDDQFDRVKMRRLLASLEDAGFSPEGLLQTASNMARAKHALDHFADDFYKNHLTTLPLGVEVHIDPVAFAELPRAVATKILGDLCKQFGVGDYLPRRDGIDRLYELIIASQEGGMAIAYTDFHWSKNRIRVCAEFEHLPPRSATEFWHRWQSISNTEFTIGALGDLAAKHNFWREYGISHRAAKTLPAVFEGENCIFVHGETLNQDFNNVFKLSNGH